MVEIFFEHEALVRERSHKNTVFWAICKQSINMFCASFNEYMFNFYVGRGVEKNKTFDSTSGLEENIKF